VGVGVVVAGVSVVVDPVEGADEAALDLVDVDVDADAELAPEVADVAVVGNVAVVVGDVEREGCSEASPANSATPATEPAAIHAVVRRVRRRMASRPAEKLIPPVLRRLLGAT
jgi:hypothetical protein